MALAVAAVFLCWLIVNLPLPAILRAPATFGLCLILPALTLNAVLASDMELDWLGRIVVAAAGTAALLVLVAVGMGMARLRLTPDAFASVVGAIVLLGLGLVGRRRRLAGAHQTDSISFTAPRMRLGHPTIAALALVCGLALAVGGLAVTAAGSPAAEPVAQLWMLTNGSKITLGVSNGGAPGGNYVVTVGPEGSNPRPIDISLGSSGTWEESIAYPASWQQAGVVVARLYEVGNHAPIRTVQLLLGQRVGP